VAGAAVKLHEFRRPTRSVRCPMDRLMAMKVELSTRTADKVEVCPCADHGQVQLPHPREAMR